MSCTCCPELPCKRVDHKARHSEFSQQQLVLAKLSTQFMTGIEYIILLIQPVVDIRDIP